MILFTHTACGTGDCSFTDVVLQYSPLVEKLGMDENFVDVTAMIHVPPWNKMADAPVEGHVYGDNKQGGFSIVFSYLY